MEIDKDHAQKEVDVKETGNRSTEDDKRHEQGDNDKDKQDKDKQDNDSQKSQHSENNSDAQANDDDIVVALEITEPVPSIDDVKRTCAELESLLSLLRPLQEISALVPTNIKEIRTQAMSVVQHLSQLIS